MESAIGTNGRVWVSASDSKQVIAIVRCIKAADPDDGDMDEIAVKKFLSTLDL